MLQEQQGLLVHLFPNRFALVQVQKDNWLPIYTPFSGTRPTFFGDKDTFFWDTLYSSLKKHPTASREVFSCSPMCDVFIMLFKIVLAACFLSFCIVFLKVVKSQSCSFLFFHGRDFGTKVMFEV